MGFLDSFFGDSHEKAEEYRDWLLNGVDELEEHFKKDNQSALSNLESIIYLQYDYSIY